VITPSGLIALNYEGMKMGQVNTSSAKGWKIVNEKNRGYYAREIGGKRLRISLQTAKLAFAEKFAGRAAAVESMRYKELGKANLISWLRAN
jgi:hypothetical protein